MPRMDQRSTERDLLARVEERLGGEALTFAVIEYLQQLRQTVGQELNAIRTHVGLPLLDAQTLPRLTRQGMIQLLRQQLRQPREET